jgi:hypothetical protein
MAVAALRGGGEPDDVTGLHLGEDALKAHSRAMVKLIPDDLAVAHDLIAPQVLCDFLVGDWDEGPVWALAARRPPDRGQVLLLAHALLPFVAAGRRVTRLAPLGVFPARGKTSSRPRKSDRNKLTLAPFVVGTSTDGDAASDGGTAFTGE